MAKDLRRSLDKKYRGEDEGCQKFSVVHFFDFKMVGSKPIMDQVEALELLCHEIVVEIISICEIFMTLCFVEKLSLTWLTFKNYLKHKKKMSFEEVIMTLQIASKNQNAGKRIIK